MGVLAAVVLVLALAIFGLCRYLDHRAMEPATQSELVSYLQAEDASACAGQALPPRKHNTFLREQLPDLLRLLFGFDPTDPADIFCNAMPGAVIARDAVIEGLDTSRMTDATAPIVTVHLNGQTHRTVLTRQNGLFQAYRHAVDGDFRVFLYHSHTTEAYADSVATTSAWRSRDDSQNMVGVGDALTEELERLGITVSHDRTYHENPDYNYAYSHSHDALQSEYENYPQTDLFIDVHRDAWIEGSSRARAVQVEGKPCAQLQFVIGKGSEDSPNPYWRENAAYAEALTEALEQIAPGITIPVRYVNSRYNQQVAAGCILVEVGHNENTLKEAHRAMKYLAQAIQVVLSQA